LGASMLEKGATGKVIELLVSDSFYSDSNKLIWQSILSLHRESNPIDILTVTEKLRKQGNLELAGGAFYVTQLTNRVASAANIEYHSHILIQKYIQRQMIHIAGEIGKKAFEDMTDAFELKDWAASMIEGIGNFNGGKIETFEEVATKVYKEMLENSVKEVSTNQIGLPSKIEGLNKISLGYWAPDVIVLAAGTGEGKTTFALIEAYNLAKLGHPVAFLCAEMKSYQLVWKIFSSIILEEIKEIRLSKNIPIEKWDELSEFVKQSHKIPLYIVDVANNNINQIISIYRELHRKYKIEMGFLDYIQLIDGSPEMKYGTREAEVAYVSKKIKQLAMELNIPIMELSQLLEIDGDGKGKRIYAMRDLRESKAIGHNADEVLFIYQPFMHGITEIEGKQYKEGDSILVRAKCRLGKKGKVPMNFEGRYNNFSDPETINIESTDYTETSKDKSDNLPF